MASLFYHIIILLMDINFVTNMKGKILPFIISRLNRKINKNKKILNFK